LARADADAALLGRSDEAEVAMLVDGTFDVVGTDGDGEARADTLSGAILRADEDATINLIFNNGGACSACGVVAEDAYVRSLR